MEINLNNNLNFNQEVVQHQNNYVSEDEYFKNLIESLGKSIEETLFENLDDVDYLHQNSKELVSEYKTEIIYFLNIVKDFDVSKFEYSDFLNIEKLLVDIKTQKVYNLNINLTKHRVRNMFSFAQTDRYILRKLEELCEKFEDLIDSYKKSEQKVLEKLEKKEDDLNNNLNVKQEVVEAQNSIGNSNAIKNFKNFMEDYEKFIKETLFENLDNLEYPHQNSNGFVLEYKNEIINFLKIIKDFDVSKFEYSDFLNIEKLLIDIKTNEISEINKNLKYYKDMDMFSFAQTEQYILRKLEKLCKKFEDLIVSYKKNSEYFQKKEREQEEQKKLEKKEDDLNNNLNVKQEVVEAQNSIGNSNAIKNFKNFMEDYEKHIKETLFKSLNYVRYSDRDSKKIVSEYKGRIINLLNRIKDINVNILKNSDLISIKNLLIGIEEKRISEIVKKLKTPKFSSIFYLYEKIDLYVLNYMKTISEDFESVINYYENCKYQKRKYKEKESFINAEAFNKYPAFFNELKYSLKKNFFGGNNFNEDFAEGYEKLNKIGILKKIEEKLDEEISKNKNKIGIYKAAYTIETLDEGKNEKVFPYKAPVSLELLKYIENIEKKLDKKLNKKSNEKEKDKTNNNDSIKTYGDVLKFLNKLRYNSLKEIKSIEKAVKGKVYENNLNLKIFNIIIKLKFKDLIKEDADKLEKLYKVFVINNLYKLKNEELKEIVNVYFKEIINLYQNFLFKLSENKEVNSFDNLVKKCEEFKMYMKAILNPRYK